MEGEIEFPYIWRCEEVLVVVVVLQLPDFVRADCGHQHYYRLHHLKESH